MNCDKCREPLGQVRIRFGKSLYHEGCVERVNRSYTEDIEIDDSEIDDSPAYVEADESEYEEEEKSDIIDIMLNAICEKIEREDLRMGLETRKLAHRLLRLLYRE